jgi:hypothetical protein
MPDKLCDRNSSSLARPLSWYLFLYQQQARSLEAIATASTHNQVVCLADYTLYRCGAHHTLSKRIRSVSEDMWMIDERKRPRKDSVLSTTINLIYTARTPNPTSGVSNKHFLQDTLASEPSATNKQTTPNSTRALRSR